MNVAKWLVLALLILPVSELVVFIAVAASIGFLPALGLQLVISFAGALLLRHAGGGHIARVRTAWDDGSFTSLHADSRGATVLLAGILLLIPGFITDAAGLLLLLGQAWRGLTGTLGRSPQATRADGVVDLPPDEWHRVADPALPDGGKNERKN